MKFIFFLCSWLTSFSVWFLSPFYLPTITFILTSFKTNFSHCAQRERKLPQTLSSPSFWRPACCAAQIGRTRGNISCGSVSGLCNTPTPASLKINLGTWWLPLETPLHSSLPAKCGTCLSGAGPQKSPDACATSLPFQEVSVNYHLQETE